MVQNVSYVAMLWKMLFLAGAHCCYWKPLLFARSPNSWNTQVHLFKLWPIPINYLGGGALLRWRSVLNLPGCLGWNSVSILGHGRKEGTGKEMSTTCWQYQTNMAKGIFYKLGKKSFHLLACFPKINFYYVNFIKWKLLTDVNSLH